MSEFFDRLRMRRSVLKRTTRRKDLPEAVLYLEWLGGEMSRKVMDPEGNKQVITDHLLESNFKLVNKKTQENPVSGYVHIIASDKTASPPQEWAFPNIKLQAGFTLNFRHGLFFRIQRFKPINVNFDFTSDAERPSTIKVLAYDLKGALILEKEFTINDYS